MLTGDEIQFAFEVGRYTMLGLFFLRNLTIATVATKILLRPLAVCSKIEHRLPSPQVFLIFLYLNKNKYTRPLYALCFWGRLKFRFVDRQTSPTWSDAKK